MAKLTETKSVTYTLDLTLDEAAAVLLVAGRESTDTLDQVYDVLAQNDTIVDRRGNLVIDFRGNDAYRTFGIKEGNKNG
jgi:hypothetical protein